jgi:hypothetical protein
LVFYAGDLSDGLENFIKGRSILFRFAKNCYKLKERKKCKL